MRKNNKLGRSQKMEQYIKSVMKFLNCTSISVINGVKWYGNYGHVCYLKDDKLVINEFEKLSTVYKLVHKIFNDTRVPQDERLFISTRWNDRSLVMIEGGRDISEGNGLFRLSNGQLYDAYDLFWFSMSQSKVLKKWIKQGYGYSDPQEFYNDCCREEERIWKKKYPDEE